jgi:hypothetical protein
MLTPARCVVASLLCLVLSACSQPEPPAANPGVENLDLAIRLSTIPEGLVVAANQGSSLELRPGDETAGGVIWFAVGPETVGVNLVAAVEEHQSHIEGLPDGNYLGAQELQGDFGTAFYSRGRYSDNGSVQEETRIMLIHPGGNRLLTIAYRYPAGDDSAFRVEQLIDVLSYVE